MQETKISIFQLEELSDDLSPSSAQLCFPSSAFTEKFLCGKIVSCRIFLGQLFCFQRRRGIVVLEWERSCTGDFIQLSPSTPLPSFLEGPWVKKNHHWTKRDIKIHPHTICRHTIRQIKPSIKVQIQMQERVELRTVCGKS